jgi:hypothetical protein
VALDSCRARCATVRRTTTRPLLKANLLGGDQIGADERATNPFFREGVPTQPELTIDHNELTSQFRKWH